MTTLVSRLGAIALVLSLGACDGDAPSQTAQEESTLVREESAPSENEVEEDEESAEDEDPSTPLDEATLDEMEDSELEAACFQGQRAACDRLGH